MPRTINLPRTNYHHLDGIEIPAGMYWTDEYAWCDMARAFTRSVSGAQIIQSGKKKNGRPITLEGSENEGWIYRDILDQLQALANSDDEDATHTLLLADGRSFTVKWADGEAPITARPINNLEITPQDYCYIATLRFIQA